MQPDCLWLSDWLACCELHCWSEQMTRYVFSANSEAEVFDTDAKLPDTQHDHAESVDAKSDEVKFAEPTDLIDAKSDEVKLADSHEPDDAKTDDSKPTQEPPVKWSSRKITDDMSPTTKKSIMDERSERKKEMSRKWHQQFESAGVTRKHLLNSRYSSKMFKPVSCILFLGWETKHWGETWGRARSQESQDGHKGKWWEDIQGECLPHRSLGLCHWLKFSSFLNVFFPHQCECVPCVSAHACECMSYNFWICKTWSGT